jgi:hypothetical protein
MPKYQVLQPIEKNNVMYVPKGTETPKLRPSAGHGKLIPVDASGEIELSDDEASLLVHGQVPMFQGKPDPIGGTEIREKRAKEESEAAAAKAAAEKAEYEEFVAFKAAKAARKRKAEDTAEEVPGDGADVDPEAARSKAKTPRKK